MQELSELKSLVLNGGYDGDSKKQVLQIEEEMQSLLQAEKLADHPVIQSYVKYLKMQSENCTYLLSNNRELTDLERLRLFDKRDLCDHFTKMFTGEEKASLENTIKSFLNVV